MVLKINIGTPEAPVWFFVNGGASSSGSFPLDLVPESPHADNDEFNGPTLDPSWELNLNGADVDVFIQNSFLKMRPNTIADLPLLSVRKPAPVGDFSFNAKTWYEGRTGTDFGHSGVAVWLPSGNIMRIAFLRFHPAFSGHAFYEITPTGTFVGSYIEIKSAFQEGHTRFEFNSTTNKLISRVSQSGNDWGLLHEVTLTGAPTHYGVCMGGATNLITPDVVFGCDFFRVNVPSPS